MSGVNPTPWEVGQHPAIPNGWIVRPILMGQNVRVLPKCEGGHVMLMDKDVAHKIAAAPELMAASVSAFYRIAGLNLASRVADNGWKWPSDSPAFVDPIAEELRAAIAKAKGLTP